MKKLFLILSLYGFSLTSHGQAALTLPIIAGIPPMDTVEVPVTGSNILSWSSLAFEFTYWNFVAQYLDLTATNPALADGFTSINYQPGGATDWLSLAWFSIIPVTITYDTLFVFRFLYYNGYTPLTFTPIPGVTTNDGSLGGGVGLSETIPNQPDVVVFPNPAEGNNVTVSTSGLQGNCILSLYTSDGRKVQETTHSISPGEEKIQLNIGSLVSGAYYLRVTGSHSLTRPLFIR